MQNQDTGVKNFCRLYRQKTFYLKCNVFANIHDQDQQKLKIRAVVFLQPHRRWKSPLHLRCQIETVSA